MSSSFDQDFVGKRVVTSFPSLTKRFFDGLAKDVADGCHQTWPAGKSPNIPALNEGFDEQHL
jgi:hypothetical protein